MLDTDDKNVLKYCNDYKHNIIIPKEIEDFSLFKTDLKNVLQMIAVSDDKELYRKTLIADESYKKVPILTAKLIKQTAGIQLDIPKGKKVVNLCLAQELLRQEAIDEGLEQGKKQGLEQGLEQGRKQTFLELLRKNIITISVAAKELEMDEEEIKKLL